MSDYEYEPEPAETQRAAEPRSRPGPTLYALIGVLIGLAVGFALAWVVGGNPFSRDNEVRYTEVEVASVSEEEDRICWAEDPQRRDSPQTCAILALDPEIEVPEQGDLVTIGIVDFRTPDGAEFRQVVHVAPTTEQPRVEDQDTSD